MSNLTIQRVTTAQQKKQFLRFPWTLYRNDPNWIPLLRGTAKEMVNYRPHPFYERNSVQTFLAVRDGVAPRRIQSGNSCLTVRRLAKPQFEHQTWIEYAKSSLLTCAWARAFVQAKTKAGKTYYTAIRALAFKWMRIIHACWEQGTTYDEAIYLAALKKSGSPYAS